MAVIDAIDGLDIRTSPITENVASVTREQAGELAYVRVVRSFALWVIVTLHVAFPLIYLYNSINYSDWWVSTNFYIWGKIGSPMFTM